MKSSTSCSTQRTARLPTRIGFGNRDSAVYALMAGHSAAPARRQAGTIGNTSRRPLVPSRAAQPIFDHAGAAIHVERYRVVIC